MSGPNLKDDLNDLARTQAVKMAGYVRNESHRILRSLLANENNFAGISVSDVTLHPSNGAITDPSENSSEVSLTDTVSSFNSSENSDFPFASDANATDVGNLTEGKSDNGGGQSSTTHGYHSGGYASPGATNVIEKFSFSSNGNASDVGDLTQARSIISGQTSTASGYTSGGSPPSSGGNDTIDKFPFASDANATDVGNLTQGRYTSAGQQV